MGTAIGLVPLSIANAPISKVSYAVSPKHWGYRFGCPDNTDHNILGSILGSPCAASLFWASGLRLMVWNLGFRAYRLWV